MDKKDHYKILHQINKKHKYNNSYNLSGNEWLHAWKPDEYDEPETDHFGRRYIGVESQRGIHTLEDEKEENEVLDFITDQLLEADPTEEKKYFKTLARWFVSGLTFSDLPEVTNLLERYEAEISSDPKLRTDPFILYRIGNHKYIRRRSIQKDPLEAYYYMHEFTRFLDRYDESKKRAEEFLSNPINKENLVHDCDEFRLYERTSGEYEGCIELILSNGYRYFIRPDQRITDGYFYVENEDYTMCMPERMVRDIDGLGEALAPIFIKLFEDGDRGSFLQFVSVFKSSKAPLPFENGLIAKAFEEQYKKKLRAYEGYKKEESRYREEDNVTQYPFFQLVNDLSLLVSFPKEREFIDKKIIENIFSACFEANPTGTIRQTLNIINTVPQWRDIITPKSIAPTFNEMSNKAQRRRANFDDKNYLSKLMTFIATTPHWRDGSEAEHLPPVINHLLETKDWKKLRTILICATHLNDPVSEMWRDAIPYETRSKIEQNQFDNSYKHHQIDLLMRRFSSLDKGQTQMYRLDEMPKTETAFEFYRKTVENKRNARAAEKAVNNTPTKVYS